MKINELRKYAQEKLENKFDIREFHETVLENGSIPLDLLDTKVKEWIQKNTQ